MKANLADSLAQPTANDGLPRDLFIPAKRPLTVNEYVVSYSERVNLPFRNSLSWELMAAYRNLRLKPSFNPDGGYFEGRYYWPMRYYIGGRNFLSGYPYFVASGSKLIYGRMAYGFPVFRRINKAFLNFIFWKLYAVVFAEDGAVGYFIKLKIKDFNTD